MTKINKKDYVCLDRKMVKRFEWFDSDLLFTDIDTAIKLLIKLRDKYKGKKLTLEEDGTDTYYCGISYMAPEDDDEYSDRIKTEERKYAQALEVEKKRQRKAEYEEKLKKLQCEYGDIIS